MRHRLSQLPVENIKPKLPAAPAREVKLFPYDSISIKHFFGKASKNVKSGQIQTAAPAFAETDKAAAAFAEIGKAAAALIPSLPGHVHFPCGHESYD
jgi:hypothetical protein